MRRYRENIGRKTIFTHNPGTYECLVCAGELDDGRKRYCSPKCKKLASFVSILYNWRIVRKQVLKRDNYTCQNCGKEKNEADQLHVDYIVPFSKGGPMHDEQNLQTLCRKCNTEKGDKIELEDFKDPERKIALTEYFEDLWF